LHALGRAARVLIQRDEVHRAGLRPGKFRVDRLPVDHAEREAGGIDDDEPILEVVPGEPCDELVHRQHVAHLGARGADRRRVRGCGLERGHDRDRFAAHLLESRVKLADQAAGRDGRKQQRCLPGSVVQIDGSPIEQRWINTHGSGVGSKLRPAHQFPAGPLNCWKSLCFGDPGFVTRGKPTKVISAEDQCLPIAEMGS
jgi:hypothetical protein